MRNLKQGSLELIINEMTNGKSVKMEWCGVSDNRNPSEFLNPYLDDVLNHYKGKILLIEFQNLKFMNSSTVPPIIRFIKGCSNNGIETTITFSKNLEWQMATFKPLHTVCTVLKNVKVLGV